MKKKVLRSKLSLGKKQIVTLGNRETLQVQGGIDTKANCPPSVGCTVLQACITCNCPDW